MIWQITAGDIPALSCAQLVTAVISSIAGSGDTPAESTTESIKEKWK
jgi:hypothetical protein